MYRQPQHGVQPPDSSGSGACARAGGYHRRYVLGADPEKIKSAAGTAAHKTFTGGTGGLRGSRNAADRAGHDRRKAAGEEERLHNTTDLPGTGGTGIERIDPV